MNFLNEYKTHYEVIDACMNAVSDAFYDLGAICPSLSDLASGFIGFRNAKVYDKKLKGKVGYAINLSWYQGRPSFILTVNSFKGGQQTRVVNSGVILSNEYQAHKHERNHDQRIKAMALQKQAQAKSDQEAQERLNKFNDLMDEYKQGCVSGIQRHPYCQLKKITAFGEIRLITNNRLCIPLHTVNERFVGFQTIDAKGYKLKYAKVQGSTKGAFAVVEGSIHDKHLFIAEGYATCDKVNQLKNKRYQSVGIICAVNAGNIPHVVKDLKTESIRTKKEPIFHLCADNDVSSFNKGDGNAGVRFALEGYLMAGKQAKYYVPEHDKGSDWDDLWHQDYKEAKDQFKPKVMTRLEASLNKLKALPHNTSASQLYFNVSKTIREALIYFPAILSEKMILDKIGEAVSSLKIKKKEIIKILTRHIKQYKDKAHQIHTINPKTEGISYIEVDSIKQARKTIDTINATCGDQGVVALLKAQMGTGKTQGVLKPTIESFDDGGSHPIAIAPICSLVEANANLFNIHHYKDNADFNFSLDSKKEIVTALATTINSMPNKKFQGFCARSGMLIVDEFTQVLRSITSGTVKDYQRLTTERALATQLYKSKLSILADADMNQTAVDYIKSVVPNHKIIVVVVKPKKQKKNYHVISSTDGVLNHAKNLERLQSKLSQGSRIFCTSDSKQSTEEIYVACKGLIKEDDILLIHSESASGEKQQAFLSEPNAYLAKNQPKLVITSPCVQSGISIELDYFNQGFGFYKHIVTPTYFRQMLHRVRPVKDFYISMNCPIPSHNTFLEDPDFILRESIQHHIDQYHLDQACFNENDALIHKEDRIQLSEQVKPYCWLSSQLKALDQNQRNHASNYLLLHALSEGIHIIYHDPINDEDKKELKNVSKAYQSLAKDQRIAKIVNAHKMTESEYTTLKQSHQLSVKEHFDVTRFEVSLTTGKLDINDEDVKYHQASGSKYLKTLESMRLGLKTALLEDEKEVKAGVAIVDEKWRATEVKLGLMLFDTLGIHLNDLEGDYNTHDAYKVLMHILNDDNLLRFVRLKLKIQLKDNYVPIKLVRELLRKLCGLKQVKATRSRSEDRVQRYRLCSDKVKQTLSYLRYRQEKKVA
jgi:phage/plasmid primase-like uncharacterized protein